MCTLIERFTLPWIARKKMDFEISFFLRSKIRKNRVTENHLYLNIFKQIHQIHVVRKNDYVFCKLSTYLCTNIRYTIQPRNVVI